MRHPDPGEASGRSGPASGSAPPRRGREFPYPPARGSRPAAPRRSVPGSTTPVPMLLCRARERLSRFRAPFIRDRTVHVGTPNAARRQVGAGCPRRAAQGPPSIASWILDGPPGAAAAAPDWAAGRCLQSASLAGEGTLGIPLGSCPGFLPWVLALGPCPGSAVQRGSTATGLYPGASRHTSTDGQTRTDLGGRLGALEHAGIWGSGAGSNADVPTVSNMYSLRRALRSKWPHGDDPVLLSVGNRVNKATNAHHREAASGNSFMKVCQSAY
jgi:hypothetical protein